MVYVISKDGQPLMPTKRSGKVYQLLKSKQARVVRRCPFTIKLLYEPETLIVQEVVLGQDTGSKYIGTACVGNNKVLYQSQIKLSFTSALRPFTLVPSEDEQNFIQLITPVRTF